MSLIPDDSTNAGVPRPTLLGFTAILAPVSLLIAVSIDWYASFTTSLWDWDVDHFIYFGQRLLAGDFHWTAEFDDKLAINQILFALPATFNSPIRAWQTLSVLGASAAAAAVAWLILDSLHGSQLSNRCTHFAALCGAAMTLFGFSYLPGGISHMNAFATSAGFVAVALLVIAKRSKIVSRSLFTLFAALLASIAIGIRPYLLPALLSLPIWLCLRQMGNSERTWSVFSSAASMQVLWTVLVGGFGIIANVFPYILLGDIQAFRDGMHLLSQNLVQAHLSETVYLQYRSIFFEIAPANRLLGLVWLLSGCFAVHCLLTREYEVLPRRAIVDIAMLSLMIPLLIQMMILERHYWPHYLQMFVPFAAFGAAMLYAVVTKARAALLARASCYLLLTLLLVFLVYPIKARVDAINAGIVRESVGEVAFNAYLDDLTNDQVRFLAPLNMHIHWQRSEARHGFPHAANTRFIAELGWWQNITLPPNSDLPRNMNEYCTKLTKEGPEIVVFFTASPLIACMNNSSAYQETYLAEGVWLFQRS